MPPSPQLVGTIRVDYIIIEREEIKMCLHYNRKGENEARSERFHVQVRVDDSKS